MDMNLVFLKKSRQGRHIFSNRGLHISLESRRDDNVKYFAPCPACQAGAARQVARRAYGAN